jgi:hypothetical protein
MTKDLHNRGLSRDHLDQRRELGDDLGVGCLQFVAIHSENRHHRQGSYALVAVAVRRPETYRSLADAVADPGDASASAIVAQLVPAAEIH